MSQTNGAHFLDPLRTEFREGRCVVLREMRFIDDEQRLWRVPAGFVTDLSSYPRVIPGFLRWLLPTRLESAAPGVLHDWLYATHGIADHQEIERGPADHLYWLANIVDHEKGRPAFRVWLGVRIGGRRAWRNSFAAWKAGDKLVEIRP